MSSSSPVTHPDFPGPILLIEDDRDICDAVIEVLADEGYETIAVGNGTEALAHLRSTAARPALVVLDLMLPVMDAWQFRSVQMNDPKIADIPVVIFSANPKIAQHAEALGAAGIIRKPPDINEMLAVVSRFVAAPAPPHEAHL